MKRLPKVQFDFASRPETTQQKAKRQQRQAAVSKTFQKCWSAYRKYAWGQDELAPISGGGRDTFGGWAANVVDNLDNLWMMGMKDEFEEAVQVVVNLDLTKCSLEMINVFETTIRHLGGLLSAYDLSGDERLLEKAKEFGSMLLVAFDTPNRMPITRWVWAEALGGKQEADEHVLVAEIGSLSIEFTRLSMVTGDMRWYDAIDRIYQVLETQQQKTNLPGMWPVTVNARKQDFTDDSLFTLSSMSDSLYEYLPKMHALLGGTSTRYETLYASAMDTAIAHNLFRPMTPDSADILISGSLRKESPTEPGVLDPQGQHLVCFAGGMFALGSRLFANATHLDIGKKLVDGCIWTYRAMPQGIMPEVFRMLPCDSRKSCAWNETAWHAAIRKDSTDPIASIIADYRLPPGFVQIQDHRYILRPEAIESVFLLYRITGAPHLLDAAWEMFEAIVHATETPLANAALRDISFTVEEVKAGTGGGQVDSMESFWMAETLKYFWLIFGETDVVDLDEWVFNTEAHPMRRAVPG